MTKREGDPGTWSHCGRQQPHHPHLHTVVFNEGPYNDVQCNGTQQAPPPELDKISEVEHYLIVRIREPRQPDPKSRTPLARVRAAIHDAAEEHALTVGDIVLRGDRARDITGRSIGDDYATAAGIYSSALDDMRTFAAAQPPRVRRRGRTIPERSPEEKAQQRHRRRAMRALATVERYVEQYGEADLIPRGSKRGKHA